MPLNPTASAITAEVTAAASGRVVYRHHDLPWERASLAVVEGIPPHVPSALHVTINEGARDALATRGIAAVVMWNSFDFDEAHGDRDATRAAFGFGPDTVVLLQPTRAIPRKNVPGALEYAGAVAELIRPRPVHLWITGPAEDGYGPELARLVDGAPVPVTIGRAARAADAYAACEIVLFPSIWEGFGNPVVESVAHRRPLVVGHYPALDALLELGLATLPLAEPERAVDWLEHPDPAMLDRNIARLQPRLSITDLPERLSAVFADHGWSHW